MTSNIFKTIRCLCFSSLLNTTTTIINHRIFFYNNTKKCLPLSQRLNTKNHLCSFAFSVQGNVMVVAKIKIFCIKLLLIHDFSLWRLILYPDPISEETLMLCTYILVTPLYVEVEPVGSSSRSDDASSDGAVR